MHGTRGKPFRRRSLTNIADHHRIHHLLRFPAASISAILLFLVFLSTLSALYISAKRNSRATITIDLANISAPGTLTDKNQRHGHDEVITHGNEGDSNADTTGPAIRSIRDLSPSELHPQAGPHRHIVTPPLDTSPVSLVTCSTTAGYLHILVHASWAPLGAQRFLQMVNSKYFSTKVALMRCVKLFLCQFGIAGDPSYNKPYNGKKGELKDDPNWLPEGPAHRQNERGVKRFAKGYLAYAGAGINTRSNQLIVALDDNGPLGGGSPWEVPWGELVGMESFRTLDHIYTGYGEKGPSQGRLSRQGSAGLDRDFPKLDYILGCDVIETG